VEERGREGAVESGEEEDIGDLRIRVWWHRVDVLLVGDG